MSDPHQGTTDALLDLIDQVRGLFHQLKAAARDIHEEGEMTGGRRGVLLDLLRGGAQSVPAMARSRPVSRQHIQTLVNGLLDDGFVELLDNPRHRRSKLVTLTDVGRDRILGMIDHERRVIEALPLAAGAEEIRSASEVLRATRAALRGPGWDDAVRRHGPERTQPT